MQCLRQASAALLTASILTAMSCGRSEAPETGEAAAREAAQAGVPVALHGRADVSEPALSLEVVNEEEARKATEIAPPATVADVLAAADSLPWVGGDAVGIAGEKDEFYAAAEVLIEHGTAGDHLALLGNESPVARALGLYCLMRTRGAMIAETLRAQRGDHGRFLEFAGGCCVFEASVATFARNLLHDRNYLQYGKSAVPLLRREDLLAFDFQILADDRAASVHADARSSLYASVTEDEVALRWDALVTLAPDLTDVQRVKALSRLRKGDAGRDLLRALLRDPEARDVARLAAASALRRAGDEDGLRASLAWLDARPEGALGSAFLATIAREHAFLRATAALDDCSAGAPSPEVEGAVAAATEPFAAVRLCELVTHGVASMDARVLAVRGLRNIVDGIGSRNTPDWDVDTDVIHAIAAAIAPMRDVIERKDPEGLQELRAVVAAHVRGR